MRDLWLVVTVAIGFPLFGMGVFFWWRMQYGVWSPRWRARQEREQNVRVVRTDEQPRPGPTPGGGS